MLNMIRVIWEKRDNWETIHTYLIKCNVVRCQFDVIEYLYYAYADCFTRVAWMKTNKELIFIFSRSSLGPLSIFQHTELYKKDLITLLSVNYIDNINIFSVYTYYK